jgi:large subunit ribosomal protein L6
MHLDLKEEIEIPGNVNIKLESYTLTLKGPKGEITKKFPMKIKHEGNKFIIEHKNATKNQKKLIKTSMAHIKNMINGVLEGYEYSLQICSVHFPMNVTATKENVIIKNFLGETKERKAVILPNVSVEIKGDIIKVSAADIEAAGQTSANIESSLRVKNKDRRIFQDGIWIIEKPGVEKE